MDMHAGWLRMGTNFVHIRMQRGDEKLQYGHVMRAKRYLLRKQHNAKNLQIKRHGVGYGNMPIWMQFSNEPLLVHKCNEPTPNKHMPE